MLVVTRHVRGEEHFIGVVWQMNAGDQLGEGIFGNDDMAASGCDYIVSENGKRVDV